MKKTSRLTCLFLFLTFVCYGQGDTLVLAKQNIHKTAKSTFTEKDILIDSAKVESRTFDNNFKSKYSGRNFVYEHKSKETNIFTRFLQWLSKFLGGSSKGHSSKNSVSYFFLIVKIIAFLVIIFAIYIIVKSILNKEGSWVFGRNSDKKIIHYDEVEKNIQTIDFENLIQQTLGSGEKRLTIRYYYLWLLKKLAAKEIIIWDVEKTNTDYLYEIKNQKLKDDFAYSSYLYNYIWYGEFDLDDDTFEKAKTTFDNTIKSI